MLGWYYAVRFIIPDPEGKSNYNLSRFSILDSCFGPIILYHLDIVSCGNGRYATSCKNCNDAYSKGPFYCKGDCEWNPKSDLCHAKLMPEEKYIVVRDPMRGPPEFKGFYSNLTLAENTLKEFGDKGGLSMIVKVVGGIIEENESEIEAINSKIKNYDNIDEVRNMIEILKLKCKLIFVKTTYVSIFCIIVKFFSLSDQNFPLL